MIGGSANRSWLVDQRQMAVYSNTFTTFMRTEKHTMHIKVESGPAPSKALSPLLHTSNILLSFEKSTPPKGVELGEGTSKSCTSGHSRQCSHIGMWPTFHMLHWHFHVNVQSQFRNYSCNEQAGEKTLNKLLPCCVKLRPPRQCTWRNGFSLHQEGRIPSHTSFLLSNSQPPMTISNAPLLQTSQPQNRQGETPCGPHWRRVET